VARETPTIYDVASHAGVSIASVSRVLNGQRSPRADTVARVMAAVRELGFVPDGAARALSNGLKEVVGVVFRRGGETPFADEEESLLFIDVINRGIELAAHCRRRMVANLARTSAVLVAVPPSERPHLVLVVAQRPQCSRPVAVRVLQGAAVQDRSP